MRADRLIALALLLQARGRLTAQELAARLEVSVRTIYRDLDALSAAGVPVYAAPGPGGGVMLPKGYKVDLTALKPEEAQAVFLGGVAGPLADLGVGAVLESALRKLSAALPAATRDSAERARQRLLVDASDWWQPPLAAPVHLRTIEEAIWQDRRLRLTYARYGSPAVERVLDPYALVAKRGVWYLVAAPAGAEGDRDGQQSRDGRLDKSGGHDGGSGDDGDGGNGGRLNEGEGSDGVRVYRVSRVQAAELLGAPSRRPEVFDLAGFWARWCTQFLATRPSYRVRLRTEASIVRRLAITFAKGGAPATPIEGAGGTDPAGSADWVTIDVDLETPDIACSTVLGYGPDIEVVEPPELRERVAQRAAQTAALYGGH